MPIDPSRLNAVGDLVVTEVEEFRALADPERLDLFDLVQREGPLTVEDACALLGRPRLELLPEEVERLQQDLEELLEPFINRPKEDRPLGSSPVRITAYFLPEPLVP